MAAQAASSKRPCVMLKGIIFELFLIPYVRLLSWLREPGVGCQPLKE